MLAAVASADQDMRQARERLISAVRAAREGGASYADVGRALGTTRQAAWERFGRGHDARDT